MGRLTVLHEIGVVRLQDDRRIVKMPRLQFRSETEHAYNYNFQYEFVNGNGNRTRSNIYSSTQHGRRRGEKLYMYYGLATVSSAPVW